MIPSTSEANLTNRNRDLEAALARLQSEVEALTIDLALLRAENVRLRWEMNHRPENHR